MIANPYRLAEPSLVSFSGGRTSAFMLRMILDAHGGTLPPGIHAAFANTGKERPETLDFVHRIETEWSVPVQWLEYRYDDGHTYAVVDYARASRNGEPFAELIAKKQYLPNPLMRYCTIELKIRVMKKFMLAQGYEEWDSVLGLRADEPMRVHRASLSCAKERWTNVMPMARAGHAISDVMSYWEASPFDLQLQQHEGNCDLCFLKGAAKIERIMLDRPDLSEWWIEQERLTGNTFRCDRPSYANLMKILKEQTRFDFDSHEYDVCSCTD